jgi:hypothetical protein
MGFSRILDARGLKAFASRGGRWIIGFIGISFPHESMPERSR